MNLNLAEYGESYKKRLASYSTYSIEPDFKASVADHNNKQRFFDILKYYNVHHGLMTCVSEDGHTTLNSSEKKKILFVDDDPDTTWISKTILEHNGFEVQTFESSRSALENFRPGSYDLLVVDIKMRDMDGFELYDKIRKMDNDINVCFLTAAKEYYDKYKQRCCNGQKRVFFITKPVSLKALVNTINSILN